MTNYISYCVFVVSYISAMSIQLLLIKHSVHGSTHFHQYDFAHTHYCEFPSAVEPHWLFMLNQLLYTKTDD